MGVHRLPAEPGLADPGRWRPRGSTRAPAHLPPRCHRLRRGQRVVRVRPVTRPAGAVPRAAGRRCSPARAGSPRPDPVVLPGGGPAGSHRHLGGRLGRCNGRRPAHRWLPGRPRRMAVDLRDQPAVVRARGADGHAGAGVARRDGHRPLRRGGCCGGSGGAGRHDVPADLLAHPRCRGDRGRCRRRAGGLGSVRRTRAAPARDGAPVAVPVAGVLGRQHDELPGVRRPRVGAVLPGPAAAGQRGVRRHRRRPRHRAHRTGDAVALLAGHRCSPPASDPGCR